MKLNRFFLLLVCFGTMAQLNAAKVGLLIVATGKYISFVKPLLDSANKYFCPEHEVTYFIFTEGTPPAYPNVVKFYHERVGWPYDTMMRCAMYLDHADELAKMDYLFACDADMLFADRVSEEIFSDRVATLHPGYYWGKRGTYDTNRNSTACVSSHEGEHYFAGGFYGGSSDEFIKMTRTMVKNIRIDLDKNIIALWHDESHLNRYFIDNPPTKILNPSYCYVEKWNLPFPKKLEALVKNHEEFRS